MLRFREIPNPVSKVSTGFGIAPGSKTFAEISCSELFPSAKILRACNVLSLYVYPVRCIEPAESICIINI